MPVGGNEGQQFWANVNTLRQIECSSGERITFPLSALSQQALEHHRSMGDLDVSTAPLIRSRSSPSAAVQ
jgi:hypothetical protein